MYVTTAYDRVFAIDARTGDRLWKHPPLSGHFAECCGAMNRGAAITDKFVLIGQLDGVLVAHVVALMIMTAALTGVSARAETSNDQTLQTRVASALGQARRFESLRRFSDASSLGVLQSAIYTMQSATDISALNVEKFTSQRRMIVQGWAEILKTIEQSYDPALELVKTMSQRHASYPQAVSHVVPIQALSETYAFETHMLLRFKKTL
ncbi:MAG TPA: hypothetical protein VGN11_08150 [Candidatus Baltobacteraceae bacterium]|jgi:hypothetical protein|nr:hypothetical protein [Candidatus Baltobacteraceae bacterium]